MDGWLIFVIFWLFILTAGVVIFGVLVGLNKVDFGPTGPAGPTGPTGHNVGALTTLSNLGPNLAFNPLNVGLSNVVTNTCGCNGVGGVMPNVASCSPCQFNNINGVGQFQMVEGGQSPQIINWVLTTNAFNYDGKGTFTLPTGQYQLMTTVVYPNQMNIKYLAVWLRHCSANHVVSTNDLIGQPAVVNSQMTTLTKTVTFNVTNDGKNRLSVLTWHDGMVSQAISSESQFVLRKVA